jgi:hypothetical protein
MKKPGSFACLFHYTNYIFFSDRVHLDYKSRAGPYIYLFPSLLSLEEMLEERGGGCKLTPLLTVSL